MVTWIGNLELELKTYAENGKIYHAKKKLWSTTEKKNFTINILIFTPVVCPESFTIVYNAGNAGNNINLHPITESPNIKVCIVQSEGRFRLKNEFHRHLYLLLTRYFQQSSC